MVILDVAYAIKDTIEYVIEIRGLQMTKKENKTSAETLSVSLRSIQQHLHETSSELTTTEKMKAVFTKIKYDVNFMNPDIQLGC